MAAINRYGVSEDKYDKNVANIIMGNCTVWVYLAAAGKETNELISSKLGKYTTLKYSSSGNKARYSNPSSGFSSQLEGRELLTADELARFARPYQLVMVLGEWPAVMVSYDLHNLYNIKYGNKDAWKLHNRLALGGTADTALMELLKRKPNIRNICLCLDNDSAGRAASATIRQKLMSMGYMNVYERFSREKDYNEELLMVRKTEIEISYE